MHYKFQIIIEWTFWYPHLMTQQTQAIEQESVNSFICLMLNTMGQDCKDEKLSQQLPYKG